jgi:hypothetical protein
MTISEVKGNNLRTTHNSSVISQSVTVKIRHAVLRDHPVTAGNWYEACTGHLTTIKSLNDRISGLLYVTLVDINKKIN